MKQELLLHKLYEAKDYLSGEELCRQLGISRTGVWKMIRSLREAGYDIEARTNLGYRLRSAPDALTAEEIGWRLPQRDGQLLRCFPLIDSTNTYLKQQALLNAADSTVAVANQQSGGRGRRERSFQSPAGKGLYLSVLWRPGLAPESVLSLTGMAAVAVCDAIEEVCALRPGIKWTNDLLLNGKKICGILTEMALEGETGAIQYVVVGIGINVHQTAEDFTPEVAAMATSLSEQLGYPVSRPALAAALIRRLDQLRGALARPHDDYLQRYRRDCLTLGQPVQLLWKEEKRLATAVDMDEQFGLVVEYPDGSRETVRSGEVSVRGLYGYAP